MSYLWHDQVLSWALSRGSKQCTSVPSFVFSGACSLLCVSIPEKETDGWPLYSISSCIHIPYDCLFPAYRANDLSKALLVGTNHKLNGEGVLN